ncbi:hypothetical protein F4777DRAFT_581653 [Nemania sp. FL0916]|nr:hypothetical protein F4777DRAFT_581653 [Nemania sp. FL0916]
MAARNDYDYEALFRAAIAEARASGGLGPPPPRAAGPQQVPPRIHIAKPNPNPNPQYYWIWAVGVSRWIAWVAITVLWALVMRQLTPDNLRAAWHFCGRVMRAARRLMIFFMVMPAFLIGGFFRRGRFVVVCNNTQTPEGLPARLRDASLELFFRDRADNPWPFWAVLVFARFARGLWCGACLLLSAYGIGITDLRIVEFGRAWGDDARFPLWPNPNPNPPPPPALVPQPQQQQQQQQPQQQHQPQGQNQRDQRLPRADAALVGEIRSLRSYWLPLFVEAVLCLLIAHSYLTPATVPSARFTCLEGNCSAFQAAAATAPKRPTLWIFSDGTRVPWDRDAYLSSAGPFNLEFHSAVPVSPQTWFWRWFGF